MRLLTICLLFVSVFLFACGTQKKIPYNYIENVTDTTKKDTLKIFEPIIQKNDLLYIRVFTTGTDAATLDVQWNLPGNSMLNTSSATSPISGFLVDQDGN